jgi:transcriptional regulator with XRE-family HTH domain
MAPNAHFGCSPLAQAVHLVHIFPMTQLAQWMSKRGIGDSALADKAGGEISRSQISRIRRGISGTSRETAKRLEKITGIPWHEFIGGSA